MPKLPSPCLMLLTDRTRLSPNWTLAQAVAPAVTGGCNMVVLRETDLPPTARATVAGFVRDGVKGRVPLVLAGDPAFAVARGADGAQLNIWTAEEEVAEARAALGAERLLGVRVLNGEEARQAEAGGADYAMVEYDWSAPDAALRHLRALAQGPSIPLIVGTDVPLERVRECLEAGAAGVAVCDAAMSAYNRTEACGAYRRALEEASA